MIRGKNTKGVQEHKDFYIHVEPSFMNRPAFCNACANGCALIGYYDGEYERAYAAFRERESEINRSSDYNEYYFSEPEVLADLLDISPALAIEIEFKHLNGMPIQQIAAWLKSSEGEGDHES
jgi:hypothetical protein